MNSLLDYLSGSEFLTAIEIKDAFFTIPRHSDRLLGFRRSQGPKGFHQRFVWAVCNKGIRLVIYLDDIIVVSSSREIFCRGNYNCYSYSRVIGFYC